MNRLAQVLVLGTLFTALGTGVAAQEAPVTLVPHVRGGDSLARETLEEATAASPTVARLVTELQSSDLIVTVVCGAVPTGINGYARMMRAAGGFRHVRVVLRMPNDRRELMRVLGHELQHAVEMAGMPDVCDDESQAMAFRRVGVSMARDGYFETDAAVRTGKQVGRELDGRR